MQEIRQAESRIEQEIFKLKAELSKLEHLKHPLRSARNVARALRGPIKKAL